MIKLTPIEIERHEFKTVWRGYDPDEVRAFLAQVSQQLTTLVRDQEKAEEVLALKAQRLAQVEDYEIKLRDALLAASTLAEQTREGAKREAELMVREAEVRADQILKDGRQSLQSILRETQSLKRQRERLNVELRSVVESHLRMLENQEDNLKMTQTQWRQEEDQWREMTSALFQQDEQEPLSSRTDDDALLEARELTLALGSSLEDEEGSEALAFESTDSTQLLTPSLPEPLTNRPLSESRLIKPDNGKISLSSRASLPLQNQGGSGEASNEHSGLAKLQKVLSEVPRKVDESS